MRRARNGVLIGLTAFLLTVPAGCGPSAETEFGSETVLEVELDRVVDGDTAKVMIDGRSEYVRYIGIDTPEMSWEPGTESEECAEEATDLNAELLAKGRGDGVTLIFDDERRDRYDRLLAYVKVGGTLINEEMLRQGLATTLTIPPNDRYADEFSALESEARSSGRGLWGGC